MSSNALIRGAFLRNIDAMATTIVVIEVTKTIAKILLELVVTPTNLGINWIFFSFTGVYRINNLLEIIKNTIDATVESA